MGDKKPKIKRVFVNNVNLFSSKHIAQFLSTRTRDDEEADDFDEFESVPVRGGEPLFHIVGSVSATVKEETHSFLLEQYKSPPRAELLEHLLKCNVVVYNISENASKELIEEATWAITALNDEMENFKSRKTFILVSTVMTWTMTKPQNPDEADVPFTEEEFRRRRPHPHFRNHNELEKLVLKLGRKRKKSKLRGYVVGSGLQYGKGENLFHYFFKVSWLVQFPKVPLFGQGTNCLPMIHISDLGGVIQNIIEVRPKTRYILAVDDSKNTLEEVVRAISDIMGPRKINILPEEKAISMGAFELAELEYLKVNLSLDAFSLKQMKINWIAEEGMVTNIKKIVEEYKVTRQLLPIKICLVGPPAVGKTTIAEKLCRHYEIHHIKIQDVITEKLAQLNEIVNEEDPESVDADMLANAKKQLKDVQTSMQENNGRVSDDVLVEILQEKLNSPPCLNQGYILDGFPKTYEQAKSIFIDESIEKMDSMSKTPVFNKKIIPGYVLVLSATDEFLIKRVQGLPQNVAEKMRYTQEEFVPRLDKYKQRNSTEETVLDYFDELEIYPETFEVDTDDPEYKNVMKKMIEEVGNPTNYGLSPEEQEAEDRRKEEERQQKLAAEEMERKLRNEAALAEMAAQYQQWQKNLSELERQEDELLEARSLPLRNYLMKYMMPLLSEAMVESSKIKPDDPVDFLAEYLLRNTQQE